MPLGVLRKSNGYFNQAFLSATYKTTKAFERFTNKYTLQDSKGLLVESNWSGCPPSLRLLLAALLTTYVPKSIFFQPHKNDGVVYIPVDSSKNVDCHRI